MLATALLLAVVATATPTVSVSPEPTYIVSDAQNQYVNVDLIIDNPTAEPIDLDELRVSVRDAAGKLLVRRFIDGNGTRPSIRTADVTEVPAGGKRLVFNPFDRFPADLDLHTLEFDLKLSSKDGSRRFEARTNVKPRKYIGRTPLILPVKSRMIVYDGHDFYAHHRRWDYTIPGLRQLGFKTNFMRYSYDFVPVNGEGEMSSGPEADNANWIGFGQPIRAVAPGVVVAVVDSNADDRKFDPSTIAKDGPMKIWGNYVVIDHGNGEFSLYGHIRQSSALVKTGDAVERGKTIAAIGASGSSMFPHLHFEMQTGPTTDAEGLPSTFENYDRLLGAKRVFVKSGLVNSGDILESR